MSCLFVRQILSATALGSLLLLLPMQAGSVLSIPHSDVILAQSLGNGYRLMNEGKGGYTDRQTGVGNYYHYQVWTNSSNTQFVLQIWNNDDYPRATPITTLTFRSGREALDYFDCSYARKCIPACPCPSNR